ncbi:MAG: hypothetical protein A2505_08645 [Deltaproteobacteria bacterium RIFOXYD12_FULL_55_16]|nr:MAG: hypothetical protein A2505_08645 [Deltaproteobacteria bacterium RIFOXYD12_FULL_55_16]
MGLTTRENYRLFLYLKTFGIIALGALLAGWGIFWLFPAELGENYSTIMASMRGIRKVLYWKVALLYAAVGLPCIPAIVALHLFYSHRIAGPIYRLGVEAGKISQGYLCGNIKFRAKDNLTDMADSLCRVATHYQDSINAIRKSLAAIESQSQRVVNLSQQDKDEPELRQASEEIASNIKNIEHSLMAIRT